MEEAAAVRRAARASVDDVEPPRLRDDLCAFIDDGSMLPGVLTVLTARACGIDGDGTDGLLERAAGVQLVYDGLRLTRTLAQEDPWTTGDRDAADMDVLAADVLVSRGFYLLARTEAARDAVEVVRSFGHDQTERRTTGDDSLDARLEASVLDLAVIAGATAAGTTPHEDLRTLAADLAGDFDDAFPPAAVLADREIPDYLARIVGPVADH
ncbi:DUF7114 family protein [Halomarina litorea]|uniref:DUF7114 family protein n=1 Tax=Halomarina litorea TaxID=2961595 RepID=UPI0020C49AC1|nr:hypothetical protein [Halomarina sp. BCD28]